MSDTKTAQAKMELLREYVREQLEVAEIELHFARMSVIAGADAELGCRLQRTVAHFVEVTWAAKEIEALKAAGAGDGGSG